MKETSDLSDQSAGTFVPAFLNESQNMIGQMSKRNSQEDMVDDHHEYVDHQHSQGEEELMGEENDEMYADDEGEERYDEEEEEDDDGSLDSFVPAVN